MKPINFDELMSDFPHQVPVWLALMHWFATAGESGYVDLVSLYRAIPTVNPIALIEALNEMVQVGVLERVWKLRAPSGELLPGEWRSWRELPVLGPAYTGLLASSVLVSGFRWGPT